MNRLFVASFQRQQDQLQWRSYRVPRDPNIENITIRQFLRSPGALWLCYMPVSSISCGYSGHAYQ